MARRRSPDPKESGGSQGQLPYPTTPIYRNWFVNKREVSTSTGCQIQLDGTNENDTTLGGRSRAEGAIIHTLAAPPRLCLIASRACTVPAQFAGAVPLAPAQEDPPCPAPAHPALLPSPPSA